MNCPECRKKLWYWSTFSQPRLGVRSFVCQYCNKFIVIQKAVKFPSFLAPWGGMPIITLELEKRGYTLPPSMKGDKPKVATPPAKPLSAHPSKRGVP
jgi:hypothetical protein